MVFFQNVPYREDTLVLYFFVVLFFLFNNFVQNINQSICTHSIWNVKVTQIDYLVVRSGYLQLYLSLNSLNTDQIVIYIFLYWPE